MIRSILGVISLFLYALTTVLLAVTILCVSLIVCIIPVRKWRFAIQKNFLQRTPSWYSTINSLIMRINTSGKWDILGTGQLQKNNWYVMISNHRSWLDILVLDRVFNKKIPPLKFFMKKELLWQLPFAGLACYALGYPFMSRHSHAAIRKNPQLKGQDVATTKKACQRLRHFPTTLINFLEGTRFTEKKKERQQSPFQHLLKPHAGGIAVVMHELQDILAGVVSVTICYPNKTPSVWEFVCGRFEKIVVRYELLPITPDLIGDYYDDRNFRAHMQQWLNEIWKKNDVMIEEQILQKPACSERSERNKGVLQ
ncbi:MAG TPA: acyltransferase [Coxiellaceae bacterium]|nr:acyltransferase [Coxiellaceae bacterium]